MFLSDKDILAEVKEGHITLEPFNQKQLQPATYDIRLGNTFIINDAHSTKAIDPVKGLYPKTQTIEILDGEEFVLHPGVSILGYSKERFGSDNYLIEVNGKSSLARIGLIVHNSASIVNPGHYLNIALELCNLNNVPIVLRPGMEVAQLSSQLSRRTPSETTSKLVVTPITTLSATSHQKLAHYQENLVKKPAKLLLSLRKTNEQTSASEYCKLDLLQTVIKLLHSKKTMEKHPEYQYLDLMRELLEGDEQVDKGTGVKTYSAFGKQIRFDLSKGLPLLTTKRVYWKGVLHELYWFMSGQSNIKYLVDNDVHIWDDYPYKIYQEKIAQGEKLAELERDAFIEKIAIDESFAKEHGELPHIYGESWRRWPADDGREVDQLGWVVDEVTKDPDCHNALVTSWNPEYLYAMANPGEACRFPICHNMYQVNIKNGKLCLQLYQRSADIFLGVPFNIASYSLLAVVLAKITGYEPGEFIHTFGDVHIYENHKDQALEQLEREPLPFPKVTISDEATSLDTFKPEHVTLDGYKPHKTIKAELTVAGGYNKDLHSDDETNE